MPEPKTRTQARATPPPPPPQTQRKKASGGDRFSETMWFKLGETDDWREHESVSDFDKPAELATRYCDGDSVSADERGLYSLGPSSGRPRRGKSKTRDYLRHSIPRSAGPRRVLLALGALACVFGLTQYSKTSHAFSALWSSEAQPEKGAESSLPLPAASLDASLSQSRTEADTTPLAAKPTLPSATKAGPRVAVAKRRKPRRNARRGARVGKRGPHKNQVRRRALKRPGKRKARPRNARIASGRALKKRKARPSQKRRRAGGKARRGRRR